MRLGQHRNPHLALGTLEIAYEGTEVIPLPSDPSLKVANWRSALKSVTDLQGCHVHPITRLT